MHCLFYFLFFLTLRVSWSFKMGRENDPSDYAIVFPGQATRTTQKREMPLSLIRQIIEKNVTSIDDFMNNFVEREPFDSELEIAPRMGFEDIERSAVTSAKMAKCMPDVKTVPLGPEGRDPSLFYYPTCMRVERCGGCCPHRLLSCQPVESEIIQVSVVVVEYQGKSQLKFRSREVIGVEKHKSCKCDCIVKPEHCSRFQRYNSEKCGCECRNKDDERKCLEEKHRKFWNRDICSCMCREELECGSGFYFDPFHCSCEPFRGRRKNIKSKRPWNLDYERNEDDDEEEDDLRDFSYPKMEIP